MNPEQLIIHRLTRPADVVWSCDGPDQFPRPTELRGPIQWHRYNVWRDALGTDTYDEEAGLDALNLTDEESLAVAAQCAFIREHTEPWKPTWALPPNPFLDDAWEPIGQLGEGATVWAGPAGSTLPTEHPPVRTDTETTSFTVTITADSPLARRLLEPPPAKRPKRARVPADSSHTPPMWAMSPQRSKRDRRSARRVK